MSEPMPQGTVYEGPSGGLKKPSLWMASEDLVPGTELVVTIEAAKIYRNVKWELGRVDEKLSAIHHVGQPKAMILNSTNRKFLVSRFGSDVQKWKGARVAIFVDPKCKQVGGGYGPGLRYKDAPRDDKRRPESAPPDDAAGAPEPAAVVLADLPPGWEGWGVEERGMNRALKGTAAFREWFKTLSSADKAATKARIDEWRQTAEESDARSK